MQWRVERIDLLLSQQLPGHISEHEVVNESWFDTLTIKVESTDDLLAKAEVAGRRIDATHVGVALDETTTEEELGIAYQDFRAVDSSGDETPASKTMLRREMIIFPHPLFHDYRTETEMLLWYLKRLENKDISLTRAMIPLGSCTMKLNAGDDTRLAGVWPHASFRALAPGSRLSRHAGRIIGWLNRVYWLMTPSVAPTKLKAQGEYAGLMAIRRYYRARGESATSALYRTSAHGTNSASAVMVACAVLVSRDENGNVDMHISKKKVETHSSDLPQIMVTTFGNGVFETSIVELWRFYPPSTAASLRRCERP